MSVKARQWRKSSRSAANEACVETAQLGRHVGIRDSKLPPQADHLTVGRRAFRGLVTKIRRGDFDLPA